MSKPVRISPNRNNLTIDVMFDDGVGAVYEVGTPPRFDVRSASGALHVAEWSDKPAWGPLTLETRKVGKRAITEERARMLVERAKALVIGPYKNAARGVVEFSLLEQFDEQLRQLEARRTA